MRNAEEVLAALRRTVERGLGQKGVDHLQALEDFYGFPYNKGLTQKEWDGHNGWNPFEVLMGLVDRYGLEVDVYLGSKYGF